MIFPQHRVSSALIDDTFQMLLARYNSLHVLKVPLNIDQPTNIEDDKPYYKATGCKVICRAVHLQGELASSIILLFTLQV